MSLTIGIIQIVLVVIIVIFILLQNRGTGLGGAFGGEGAIYYTKRGIEKFLFIGTIVLVILFVASLIARLFI